MMMNKSIDGIIKRRVCPTAHRHHHIRRLFKTMRSHGMINDHMAVLFIYDKADPCKSHILKEVFDNRITNPATADAIAKSMLESIKAIDK